MFTVCIMFAVCIILLPLRQVGGGAIFKKGGTHLGGNYEEVTKHTNLTQ